MPTSHTIGMMIAAAYGGVLVWGDALLRNAAAMILLPVAWLVIRSVHHTAQREARRTIRTTERRSAIRRVLQLLEDIGAS